MKTLTCLVLFAVVSSVAAARSSSSSSDCSGHWEVFSSEPLKEFFFPDTGVRYWRYRFRVPEGKRLGFRLEGRFPHARYMNFNVYDQRTFDPVSSVADRDMVPDAGSFNPFLHGVGRDVEPRAYTALLVPKHARVPAGYAPTNVLQMEEPAGVEQGVELWYRVYLPDRGHDAAGGVGLPKVTAFSLDDHGAADCPGTATAFPPMWKALGNLPPKTGEEILSYRPGTTSLYANRDNLYLASRLPHGEEQVAVVRFRAPSFPPTESHLGTFDGSTQVRYWSLCLGGISTMTSSCVADSGAGHRDGGYLTVVIGPERLRPLVEDRGLTFLPHGPFLVPLLIYRNLLGKPGFPGNLSRVPGWPPPKGEPKDPSRFAAHRFIGDYAPTGRRCAVDELIADLGGGKPELCGVPAGTPRRAAQRGEPLL